MFSELVTLLKTLGWQVYDTDVPEQPKYPYMVVWGDDSRPHVETPLSDRMLGVQDRVGVTYAAGTPEGVRLLVSAGREVLQPGGYPLSLAGFTLKLTDHQQVDVDRDVVIAGSNRHPAFSVDIFALTR